MSFFQFQKQMMKIFTVLSICAAIQMGIMYSFDGLGYLGTKINSFAKVSMGNMGFSMSTCSKSIVEWNEQDKQLALMFQCQGTTTIGSIINTGLMYDSLMPHGIDDDSLLRCNLDAE